MRVLYIDLDCCRADHLGTNGYPRPSSPSVDRMNADPHQTVNLASQRPEVTSELMALLAAWRQQQLQVSGRPDPLEAMVATGPFLYYTPEQMYDRLERTGRGDRIPEFRARLAKYHGGPRNV